MKKIIKILLCVLIIGKIAAINPIAAQSGSLNRPFGGYQGYFQIDSYSGGWQGTHYWWAVTKIGDAIAYCIDPTRHTTLGGNYSADDFINKLPAAQKNTIWQIAYFGYGYDDDMASERYLAAQELIWEQMNIGQLRGYGGSERFAISWIDTAADIDAAKIEKYKKIINDLMGQYHLSPSFKADLVAVKVGDIVTLKDKNGLLDQYEFSFPASIKLIRQNKDELVFEVIAESIQREKLTFKKKERPQSKVTVVWGKDDDQKLFTAGLDMFDEDYGEVSFIIPYGRLRIHKTDARTGAVAQGTASLANAEFSIYDTADNHLIQTITTDENGVALSGDILSGTSVKVCETKAPEGYIRSDVCQFATVASNQTIEMTIANEVQSGSWQGVKIDAETGHVAQGQATLAGAVFAAYINGKEVERLITGIDGYTPVSQSYPLGTKLNVCEIEAPVGYELSDEPCRMITIKPNANVEVEIADEIKRGRVIIEKRDAQSGKTTQGDSTFEGLRFILTCEGMDDVYLTMDQSGVVYSEAVFPYGSRVAIREITNDCFIENDEIKNVIINDTENGNYVEFVNQVKKGRIEIIKFIDEINNENGSEVKLPGEGFSFVIYLARDNTEVAKITTDSDGRAISPDLPYGRYLVKEIGKADDPSYELIDDFEIEIKEAGKTYLKVVANVPKSGRLKVVKRNGDTNVPVEGMRFRLYRLNENGEKINLLNETDDFYETDKTGSITLNNKLIYGNYVLEEIQAPEGLMVSPLINVVIDDDLVVLDVVNDSIKGVVKIKKSGRIFNGCSSQSSDFGEVRELIYADGPIPNTEWGIYASEDIFANDIERTKLYSADQLLQTVVTDEYGEAAFDPLPVGKYYVREIKTLPGLILDQRTYDVTITEKEREFTFESFNDSLKTRINLLKSLEFNEDETAYAQVVFGLFKTEPLFDEKGETILTNDQLIRLVTFDKTGKPLGLDRLELPSGNYYLKELAAPEGYLKSDEHYPFKVDFSAGARAVVIDLGVIDNSHQRSGNLYLKKQGEGFKLAKIENTEYGPLYLIEPESLNLKAVFELTAATKLDYQGKEYQKGEVIKTIMTDDSGNASVEGLPVGEYYLREVATAADHLINQESISFTIDYRKDNWLDETELIIKNDRKKMRLEFEKIFENDDHKAYKDTVFGLFSQNPLYDDRGNMIVPQDGLIMLTGLKDEDGHYVLEKQPDLPYGDYYLKELTSSDCYEISDEVLTFDFNSSDSEEPVTVIDLGSITDRWRELNISIHKKGNNQIKLDGAVFDIYLNDDPLRFARAISGGIYLEDKAETVYELSQTAAFTEYREYVIDDSGTLVIDDLSKGIYYVRKRGEEAIRRYQIDEGLIHLDHIPYGSRLTIVEIKAPIGYILDDEPSVIDVRTDHTQNEIVIDRINDLLIIPPQTGSEGQIIFLLIIPAVAGGCLLLYRIRNKKRSF